MNGQDKPARQWRAAAAGAALVVLFGLIFLPHTLGEGLALLSYDLPFRLRPNIVTDDAVIIYMDEETAQALDEPWREGRAWDRIHHARLVERLTACRARAVVFDVLFDVPGTNDAPLLAAIQAATNAGTRVIVAGKVEGTSQPGQRTERRIVSPFDALEQVAPWGLAESGYTISTRRHFAGTDEAPSLAWRAAELTLARPLPDPTVQRWINYYGPPGSIRHRSYLQALNTNFDLTLAFSNKVCFVGERPGTPFPGGMRADEWSTPYARSKMPGVEVTATVYLNLLRQDWLRRLPLVAELLLLVLGGAGLGWGLALCRPSRAVGLGTLTALTTGALACWLMWRHHLWFSWLIAAAVQVPLAAGWSALACTRRLSREKAWLEKKLAAATDPAQPALTSASAIATARLPSPAEVTIPIARTPLPVGRPPDIPDHTMLQRIGKGAYGEVWLARNAIGTYHAVKIVRRDSFDNDDPFEREFRGLQKFMPISRSHPGLVQILHVGRHDGGFIYYVMEAADDETTGARIDPASYSPKNLAKEIRKRHRLPAAECVQLALDLAAALDFLHQQQLIHRDIKPANIIFVKNAPKFADIGLVTDMAATGRDVTYLGTKGYIAPEGPGTASADVYALGKVLYEASMGLESLKFPELPATLLERPDAAALFKLNEIILKACQEDQTRRYRSAAEMHADLLNLQRATE